MKGKSLLLSAALAGATPIAYSQDPAIQALKDRIAKVKAQVESLRIELPFDVGEFGDVISYRGNAMLVLTASAQQHARNTNRADGALSATYIFGNPSKLAVDIPISFTDLSKLGHRGTIGLRFSRVIGNGLSVSAGVDQLYQWGKSDTHHGVSARVNQVLYADSPAWQKDRARPNGRLASPFQRVTLQLGIGNGRYAPEGDLNHLNPTTRAREPRLSRFGFFGGATFALDGEASFFVRYSAHDWSYGITLRPRGSPFYGTLAVADVAGSSARYLDNPRFGAPLVPADSPRLVATLGYVIRF